VNHHDKCPREEHEEPDEKGPVEDPRISVLKHLPMRQDLESEPLQSNGDFVPLKKRIRPSPPPQAVMAIPSISEDDERGDEEHIHQPNVMDVPIDLSRWHTLLLDDACNKRSFDKQGRIPEGIPNVEDSPCFERETPAEHFVHAHFHPGT